MNGNQDLQTQTVAAMMTWKDTVIDFAIRYGFQLLGALIIIVVGLLIARVVGKMVSNALDKNKVDVPLRNLLVRVTKLLILALTLLIAADKFGINVTSLIAGIGVIGVGIGLATQGVLSNLVAGIVIILTKPFRIGEYVELLGCYGQVAQIELFATTLVHADHSRIVIPNRKISGEIMHNYGGVRQHEIVVNVGYSADMNEVMATIHSVLDADPRVLKDPPPVVAISKLADASITISIMPWTSVNDFGNASAALHLALLEQFRARHIAAPGTAPRVIQILPTPGEAASVRAV
jgi:small conductance mechanosensitive channel